MSVMVIIPLGHVLFYVRNLSLHIDTHLLFICVILFRMSRSITVGVILSSTMSIGVETNSTLGIVEKLISSFEPRKLRHFFNVYTTSGDHSFRLMVATLVGYK